MLDIFYLVVTTVGVFLRLFCLQKREFFSVKM